MKYLITGGAGFIGSHLVDALISRGDQVVVIDNFSTGSKNNLVKSQNSPHLRLVDGSILEASLVRRVMSQVDGCFHMAAAVGVAKILSDPIGSLKTNIHGTENVLDLALEYGVPVLLASTSEIYGKSSDSILDEESDRILGSPTLARWTYAEAKAIDESYAIALHNHHGLNVKIIRYFNTVGPRQSASYGMVIPRFFADSVKNRSVNVHGSGSQRRIFCHVDDAISGTLSLWDSKDGNGHVFNLAGSEEIRIIDLAERIIRLTKSQSKIELIPYEIMRKSGFEDIQRRLPDTSKLRNLTGWFPKKGITEILDSYYEYLLDR